MKIFTIYCTISADQLHKCKLRDSSWTVSSDGHVIKSMVLPTLRPNKCWRYAVWWRIHVCLCLITTCHTITSIYSKANSLSRALLYICNWIHMYICKRCSERYISWGVLWLLVKDLCKQELQILQLFIIQIWY